MEEQIPVTGVYGKVGKKYSEQRLEWDQKLCPDCFEIPKQPDHSCPNTKSRLSEIIYAQVQSIKPTFPKAQLLWVLQRCSDSLLDAHLTKSTQQQGSQKAKTSIKKHRKTKKSKKD